MSILSNSPSVSAFDSAAFDRITDPLLQVLSVKQARELAGFHADTSVADRIEELSRKSNEGELTIDERAEYEGCVRANNFVAILQAKARRRVAEAGRSKF